MMGRLWRRLRIPLLTLLSAICYLAALGQLSRLEALPAGEQIVWQGFGEGLDDAACEQILQNQDEGSQCALWREKKGQRLENPALSRGTEVTVWEVRGAAETLFAGSLKLSGEDADGCFVDRTAARAIFGDADAVGMEVVWGERHLTIRGILDEGWPLVLAHPSPGGTADRITLGGADPESGAEDFLVRHAISGITYDDSCLSGILKLLLLVLPAALCTGLLRELFPRLRGVRAALAAVLVFVCLAVVLVGIPADMIPDRWSNFEFWTAWRRGYAENIRNLLEYGNSGRDTVRFILFARGALLALLPAAMWYGSRKRG